MGWLSEDKWKSVADDYFSGLFTNAEIAKKHGIAIRSIYNCVERCSPQRRNRKHIPAWYPIKLTRAEIELALLVIMENDKVFCEEHRDTMFSLETKLLNAADRDENIKRNILSKG